MGKKITIEDWSNHMMGIKEHPKLKNRGVGLKMAPHNEGETK